jgi:hypothetical protein
LACSPDNGIEEDNMKNFLIGLMLVFAVTACSTPPMPMYSRGFNFANYDYVVISKETITALYGLDIELANLLSRYDMKSIGDKELQTLPVDAQRRTLNTRMSVTENNKQILLSISFDDAATGRTGTNTTTYTKGKIFKPEDRTKAFASAAKIITRALEKDKGLQVGGRKNRSVG